MATQLSFDLLWDLKLNEQGDLCSPSNIVITKPWLEVALKFRDEFEIASVLQIGVKTVQFLLDKFRIKVDPVKRLTEERIRIMELIQLFESRHSGMPTISYLRRRTSYPREMIEQELTKLSIAGYISFEKGEILGIIKPV
jgi:hypothetical protein